MSPPKVTMRTALRNREFRALYAAEAQSALGDQLARVAVAVLVFNHTDSPGWAALAYALTSLPQLAGSALLSGLADRYPRRAVLVTLDVLRALLVAAMALSGVAVPVVCALLVCAVGLSAPYAAAQSAIVPDLLGRSELYQAGSRLRMMTDQTAQLAGLALAGVVVAAIGARAALALDACTFLVAAIVLASALRGRPAADASAVPWRRRISGGARVIVGSPRLWSMLTAAWAASCFVAVEALAVPYAAQLHAGPRAAGALLAAGPAGAVVGGLLIPRVTAGQVLRALLVAPAAGVPLLWLGWSPPVWAAVVAVALSGVLTAYMFVLLPAFTVAVPDARRGQVMGLAQSGLVATQGLVWGAAGVVASWTSPGVAVALTAAGGIVVCLFAASAHSRLVSGDLTAASV